MRPNTTISTAGSALLVLVSLTLTAACGSAGIGASTDGGAQSDGGSRGDTRPSTDGPARPDGKLAADAGGTDARGPGDASGLNDGQTLGDASGSTDGQLPGDASQSTDGQTSSDAESNTPPTVLSTSPVNSTTGVATNAHLVATFSEAMDPATISALSFTLTGGNPATQIQGTVVYASSQAVFWPSAILPSDASFTARVTTAAKSRAGVALAADYVWGFATAGGVVAGVPVDLGTASQYVILAKAAVSTVSPSVITGNIGVSPAAATYITGFSLIAAASNVFSTSSQVTGKVYAADYAVPTPVNLTTAIGDMATAFTAAAGRAPDVTGLGAGSIGGMTLPAGVYKWGTRLLLATDVTLTGSPTDVWIFQIAQGLTVSDGVHVTLVGGALPQNVFWQVSGSATLGTTVHFEGTILCQTAIALDTGATIVGGLLAQTAVTLDANTVVTAP